MAVDTTRLICTTPAPKTPGSMIRKRCFTAGVSRGHLSASVMPARPHE
jgi:hypothetical protein